MLSRKDLLEDVLRMNKAGELPFDLNDAEVQSIEHEVATLAVAENEDA